MHCQTGEHVIGSLLVLHPLHIPTWIGSLLVLHPLLPPCMDIEQWKTGSSKMLIYHRNGIS
jgi:hypothetical protein